MRKILRNARIDAKMRQTDVANYLGISLRMYQCIESGAKLGAIKHWDKLEDLFRISQRELRKNTDNY